MYPPPMQPRIETMIEAYTIGPPHSRITIKYTNPIKKAVPNVMYKMC